MDATHAVDIQKFLKEMSAKHDVYLMLTRDHDCPSEPLYLSLSTVNYHHDLNVFTDTDEENLQCSVLHEEFKFSGLDGLDGSLQLLEGPLRSVLPGDRPLAGIYHDANGGIAVRLCVSDVGFLHELRWFGISPRAKKNP